LFKNATVDKTQTANLKNLNNPEPWTITVIYQQKKK
jgi:hypothetical protein